MPVDLDAKKQEAWNHEQLTTEHLLMRFLEIFSGDLLECHLKILESCSIAAQYYSKWNEFSEVIWDPEHDDARGATCIGAN